MNLIKQKFTSLSNRNFRIFWMLEIFSLLGVWIQSTSQWWLVYKLTDSPFLLGLVSAVQFLPVLLFSLFAGVIVDNFEKRKVLLITQSLLCFLAFVLGIFVVLGIALYWHILIFALILGIVNTFDMPARQSIILDFVDKEDLMNAVALNSSVFNVARMVGPAVAGILMRYMDIGYCFIITAFLYIPIVLFLFKVRTKNNSKNGIDINSILYDVGSGIKHILSKEILYVTIFLVMIMGIFSLNYSVFVPVLAKYVLKMESRGFGSLMAAVGLGAFLGSMFVSLRKKREPSITIIMFSLTTITIVLILSGYISSFVGAVVLLFLTGFFNNIFFTNANSMLMLNANDEFRGRIMSIYTLAFSGTSPIGNLLSGTIIDKFSVRSAFLFCGFSILIITTVFLAIHSFSKLPKSSREQI